ncbi:hypothetical protein L6164_020113 [Bauhinia variegata]|uniref:Uncharacterized protein n=1 Tax=Bauhinia variegata TaxID=167791 RepID=A0ACB9MW32_BAUVA|nr:hypothetical protein L6164_020113 [Bauhinia variegata]
MAINPSEQATLFFHPSFITWTPDAIKCGLGMYQGKYSFDKGIVQRNLFLEIKPSNPQNQFEFKMQFLSLAYKLYYFGLLLSMMGFPKYN